MTSQQQDETLYLVDASIYIFRAYFSIPPTFVTKQGQAVNAVFGYAGFLADLAERRPQYISMAFDESLNTCFRNDIYPAYKANRELPDENLLFQVACCQEITQLLGFHHLSLQDYEADDIIGTLHQRLGYDRDVVIVTRDKDLGQLLRSRDLLWDFAADDYSDPDAIKAKFGVEAHQMADYLALAGDAVDNIPGAPGIGAKTAAGLLAAFASLDDLYARVSQVEQLPLRGAKKIMKTLIENEALIRTFREITAIHCEVPLEVSLGDTMTKPVDSVLVEAFCDRMNFGTGIRARLLRISEGHATAT